MPAATSVTVAPDTVQTDVVNDVKLTVRPDVAVALSATVPVAGNGRFPSAPNVIVWLAGVTWKLWSTGVAAANPEPPPCFASMVHLPPATRVTVLPDTVQTEVVSDAKLTASPDVAVALTANGAVPMTRFASAPNVIVCVVPPACVTGMVMPRMTMFAVRAEVVVFAAKEKFTPPPETPVMVSQLVSLDDGA